MPFQHVEVDSAIVEDQKLLGNIFPTSPDAKPECKEADHTWQVRDCS